MKIFTSFFTTLKFVVLLSILGNYSAYAQPTVLGSQVGNGSYVTYDLVTRGGGVRFVRINATSAGTSGSRNWEFATGTAGSTNYTTNWRPYTASQLLSGYNALIDPSSAASSARYNTSSGGSAGTLPAVVSGSYYTFNVGGNSGSNNFMAVLSTTYNPKNITAASQSPVAASVGVGQPVVVTTTISAVLSTSETVYLRYSNDGFATSTIIPFSTSGTTLTATIPGAFNTPSAVVSYYIFSSHTATTPTTAQADYYTLNLYNASGQNASGGGTNYTYTVGATTPTYTWNQTGTASWATAGNWTPTRAVIGVYDNMVFSNGATTTVTAIPVETVGSIAVSGNTTVNLQPAGANTLTISNGAAGVDLSVASGSALNANGANALNLALATGATGSISGNMTFTVTANTLNVTDASALTFNNGSVITQGTGNSGNLFGSAGTANVVIFASGSTFNQLAGSSPFGLTQPASKITFQTGSLFKLSVANAPGLAGRTYANFEYDASGTASGTGGTAYSIDNLTVTQGILNLNVTVASSVKGNISVASGATLTFSPASAAAVNINGSGIQTISNAGTLTVAANANLTVVSGSTVSFGTSIVTGAGTFTAASGSTLRTGNTAGIASSGATGSVQTTTRTFNAGANYVYNGVANQTTGTGLPATVASLTINNTGTTPNDVVTLTNASTTTASVVLTAGKLDLNAKILAVSNGGTIAATSGDFTATAGPVAFAGTGTVTGTVNFPTVTMAGGVNFGTASNIVTSLQFNSGAFINTNAPTYGSASTLIYNTTGTYGRNLEWSATSGKGYPNNVQVQNGTIVDLAANGFADRAIAGNLNLGIVGSASAGSLSMGATTNKLTIGGNVVIGGNTSGTSTLTLSSAIGGDVYLSGNWDTKTNGAYASNTRAVFFQGAGTSTVTTIGAATFDYLFINKTSGGTVSLANDMTVNNNLTLNAQLVTNAFKVIIPTGNNVTANPNGWVNGNLQKNIPTGTNSRTFEVGDASVYAPVTTAYSGVSNAGNITVSTTTNDHPQIGTSVVLDAAKSVNRFYTIANNGVTGGTFDPTFTFVSGDIDSGTITGNLGVSHYSNPTWTPLTVGSRTSTTIQATGVTQYGDYQIGEGRTVWTAGAPSNVWLDSANWSNGVPTSTTNAYINTASVYPEINSNETISRLIVNAGTVTVNPSYAITVTNGVTNSGGTLTLENNAYLLQDATAVNTGNIIAKCDSSAIMRLDYTLWSSPVSGQELYAFSPYTFSTRFYRYLTSSDLYNNSGLGFNVTAGSLDANGVNGIDSNHVTFDTAKGYLIRTPWNHPTSPVAFHGQFTGEPNNGNKSFVLDTSLNGFNAIGNPYPSPVSISSFFSDNTSSLITQTLWFWRKTNDTNNLTSYVTFTGSTYSSGPQTADDNIQPGQGFIVQAVASGSVQFKNTQRVATTGRFLRSSAQATTAGEGRIWLYLKKDTAIASSIAIGYKEGATNDLDTNFDGKYINDSPLALTSFVQGQELAVQHRATPFANTDIVPLSFKTDAAGTYSIEFNAADGVLNTQDVYLEDLLLGQSVLIKTTPYSFTSAAGNFTDRFRLVYLSSLGVHNPTFDDNQVVIYKNETNEFVVNSGNVIMSSVKVFDIRGRLLLNKKGINASQTILNVGLSNEVLLVQITSEDGAIVTKKVIR